MEKLKKFKIETKKAHIAIIILGIIFILLAAFHSDIWFDESYSVAIANHSFTEIWNITGHDVHPPIYYWMLHILQLICGSNVIIYRVFSVLAVAILGILGYTHIRKDFGEKVGMIFSFLCYFLPVMSTYSQEVRMYSWGCLFVTVMAIYAYRMYRNIKAEKEGNEVSKKEKTKNLIIFGIFSIFCCYTHYYSLMTAFVINLGLLIYFIKNRKVDTKIFINFIILGVIQVVLYIPWLYYLMGQIKHVGGGFWITLGLNTLIEVPSFQFRRQLDTNFAFNAHTVIALFASLLMYVYLGIKIYQAKKQKKEIKPGIMGIAIYVIVILIMLIISLKSPILFSRYLFILTGVYIFFMAYLMATETKPIITLIICTVITIMGLASNITNISINYDESNMKQIKYLKENIQEGDIIVYSNIGNGGVIAAFFPEYKQYFYNGQHWDVEEAYKAYGPGMETIYSYEDMLKDYHGRIWLIDSEYMGLYEEFPKDGINVLKEAVRFDTKYQNYIYNIMLLEKE